MKTVCQRHQQAHEASTGCPYCERDEFAGGDFSVPKYDGRWLDPFHVHPLVDECKDIADRIATHGSAGVDRCMSDEELAKVREYYRAKYGMEPSK